MGLRLQVWGAGFTVGFSVQGLGQVEAVQQQKANYPSGRPQDPKA